jgi:hypothetical protein
VGTVDSQCACCFDAVVRGAGTKRGASAVESVGASLTAGGWAVCVFVLTLWLGSALVAVRSFRSREKSAVRRWMRVLLRILGL